MFQSRPWQKVVKNHKHYKALGQTEVYLDGDVNGFPWHLATECASGGSHRLDMDTSVWFYGKHPCGLTLRWSFELEKRTANGKGFYEIDTKSIEFVISKLGEACRNTFAAYLASCARAVQNKGYEWQEIASKQFKDAAISATLATSPE